MIKKIIFTAINFLILMIFLSSINTTPVLACTIPGPTCLQENEYCYPGEECIDGFDCQQNAKSTTGYSCQKSVFGKIQPPDALKGFLKDDSTGAGAISKFLSNFVVLIYSVAAIVLIFMLLWGAFDWMVSGGDKEKLSSAQKRIINAFIGILLFAVAFAVLQVLGQFTGFRFFVSQSSYTATCMNTCSTNDPAICTICPKGDIVCYGSSADCPR